MDSSVTGIANNLNEDGNDGISVGFEDGNVPTEEVSVPMVSGSNYKIQHMKQIALFLLKTKALRKVSQSALDGLVADFMLILHQILHKLKDDISVYIKEKRINLSALDSIFDPDSTDPFHNLNTKFLQEKFYKEHLNILVKRIIIVVVIITCFADAYSHETS